MSSSLIESSRPSGRSSPTRPARRQRRIAPYLFVLPFVVLFLVFTVTPLILAFWNSLHSEQASSGLGFGGTVTKFVGLDNYATALGRPALRTGLLRVLLFGIVEVPVSLGLALLLALLFDSSVAKLKRFFQFAYFLPYAIPGVVAALLWGFLYLPSVSPVVAVLEYLHLPHDFLSDRVVLWSVANISVWQYTGFNMIVIFAAIQALPRDLYEAARIDGAGEVRIAWSIKIPLLRPAILISLIFSIIGTLQLFNEPTLVRTLTPNITGDWTPNMAIYQTAVLGQNQNLAAAMALLLALLSFILSAGFLRVTQRRNI